MNKSYNRIIHFSLNIHNPGTKDKNKPKQMTSFNKSTF